MASGNHCPDCYPLESAQQDLFVLGMGRGACGVSTLDSSEGTAGEEFPFAALLHGPMEVEGCLPTQGSRGEQHYILLRNGHGQECEWLPLWVACLSGMAEPQLCEECVPLHCCGQWRPRGQPVEGGLRGEQHFQILVVVETRPH